MRLSEEQIERANTVNLPQFLMQNGFDLKRVGREYVWKDHDSMHIKDNAPGERGVWHRFSTDEGGDNIAFLRQYMNMSFVEAVEALNGEHYDRTYTPTHTDTPKKTAEKEGVPEINEADNCKRVFAYLCKTRGLDYDLIVSLVKQGLISQEEKRGNVLFKFFDENGKVIGAEKVGTSTEYRFKGIAEHSAEGHGFEVVKGSGEKAFFFESAIDMLSYLQMHDKELDNCRLVSMMGLKPSIVLDTVLRYNIPPQNVFLCSDNDEKGNQFAERLISEYPDMKRIVTPDTYKDWNDMLRGIPKKEIDTEQKTEVKKEADRMAAIGNEYWNSATDNRDKAVISMSVEDFSALFQKLEDSGLNYRAYRVASGFKMAVNAADVGTIRQLAGKNLEAAGSTVPFSPPEKNIIGNTEYRYIPNKEYISADRDLILKMAETLDKQGIKFSGRIYPTGKGTLTVSRNDLAYVRSVRDNIIGKRRQVGIGEKGQVIGNRSVSTQNRHLYMSTLTPKQYEEVKPFIETNARYSGVIRDGKVMFSVDRDEAQAFHRALDTAKREVGLIHTMQEQGLPMEQMIALSPVMHRLAVEDAQLQLSDFFDKRYDEAQFGEMLSLVNGYLDQPASERYGEHSKLNDMLEAKSSFDRTIELSDFFSQHDFSEEQKSAIATMFVGEVTRGQIDSIDETFTAEDIQEYAEILQSALQESDIADFLAEHAHSVQKQADRDQALADAFASHKDMQLSGSGDDLTNFRLHYDAEINNGEGGYNLIADRTASPIIKDMSISVLSDDISFDTFKDFLSSHNLAFESVIDTIVPEKQATEEEVLFSNADLARFLAEHTLSSDEWEDMTSPLFERGYLEKHQPSDKASFGYHLPEKELYALAERYHHGDDIRRELALGLMIHASDNIADKDKVEFVFEDGKISDRTFYYGENLRHTMDLSYGDDGITCSFSGMERFVSFEEIGQAFIDRIHEEYEDLAYWAVLDYIKDDIPNISDDTVKELITAFDGAALHGWENGDNIPKLNRIKKALYDILGDEEQTEKAFAVIAKNKYNVSFEPELTDDEKYFRDTDIVPLIARMSLDYDAMERLEYCFCCDGYIESHAPGDFVFDGGMNMEDLYSLIYRMRNGEDISRELVLGLLGDDEPSSIKFTDYDKILFDKEETDNGLLLTCGNVQREVSFKELYDAFLTQFEKDFPRLLENDLVTELYNYVDDIDDEQAIELISVFDNAAGDNWQNDKSKQNMIKTALSEYLGDPEQAEYVFEVIAERKYNFKAEPETKESPIHFGLLGNGITVYDTSRIDSETHDYPTVAHISAEGIVKIYDDNISAEDMERINAEAQSAREKFMSDWSKLSAAQQFQRLLDRADISTSVNISADKSLSMEQKIEKYMPFVFFGEGERPEPEKIMAVVSDLAVGDIIMYDGARREIEEISPDRIKMKDLDAPDYGGILLSTSDVLAYDGWQQDMEEKGFEILSTAEKPVVEAPEQAEPEDKGPVSLRKVGDFYEMYGKNAEIGAEVLGLRMLSKNGSPMVGFPAHIKDEYSAKLREAGYSVLIEQAFELNPPKREPEKLQTLQQVVDKFFGTDCESAETEGGTWKLAIADGDKVGELFYGGEHVCGIYNRGDKMEIEPYRELSTFPKLLQTAMLEHNPDKPVEIMDFQRTFETPLDKAKWLINDFCEAEYREGADFDDLHNVGLAFTTLTDDELPIQVTADLIDFKITHEFDGEVFDTEQFDSIEDMIENGLTDLDFSDLVSVPDEVIERHTGKDEQTVELMSDAADVADISSPAEDVPSVTLKYKSDAESLDEIKDKALSLGATVIVDNAEGVISIDTYADHKDKLDNLAYELGVMSVDDVPFTDAPTKETEEIDDDAPLFADDDVIEQIQADEKADIPFWEKPDIEGEQLSLFGDPEPIQSKAPDKAKSEFAPGPVVDGVQVFEALAAEIDRGTGFVNGKIRVQEFYEKSKSQPNHPTIQELADFLKKEYGIGGHSGEGNISLVDYDSKGMTFSFENGEKFRHSWHDVAVMTESRLKDNTYLSPEQQEQWQAMKAERSAEENFEPYKVEIGDKFRNKATGVVSEVVSLTGALPYYTDDCTVKRLSGAFEITENISYDKLLNSGLYEYIGRNEPEKEQSAPVKPEMAEVTPDKPEIPTVKNLNQLKKNLKPGMMFEITDHLRPECIGERRVVTGVTTVDFTSRKLDENGEPTGKDLHMEFDRAKNWTFDGGELTSRLDNGDMLMSFHFIDSLERTKEPELAPEKNTPELSVGDYLEYKGKEYKVESLDENGFITLNNTAFEGAIKDRVTFIADEFLSNGDFKIITPEKSEKEVTATDKGENFIISDDTLGEGGAKSKFRANVDAIRTLKTLEAEKRPATAEEKETLSRYVGWGAIPQAFDKSADKWSAEYKELSELLTPEEYRQARSTVGDAFYTSPTIIEGIYEALGNFGFEGGNVLEPAMGVGNFFGCMPKEMQDSSHLYGVEIDSISGRIAQALYPDADIAISGFEKNSFQNGCFDVAVGNVPFGELGFKDEKHSTTKLHDYFFMEAMDKVKDGGIVAFVTSAGTLDKRDENVRQMLADKADLIGAIRLPGGKNGAFKDNAGTEVTTDIIFLQKREGKSVVEMSDIPDWVHIGETADGLPINQYFADNPDMVLGKVVEGNKLYGSGTMVVAEDGFDLKSALHEAVSKLSAEISHDKARDVYAKTEQGLAVKIPSDLRNFSFFLQDDKVYFKKNAVSFEQRFDKKNAQFGRYKAFIELRDITRELIQAQELNKPDSVIADLQAKLGKSYDDFYNKYGLIHSKTNKRYFNEDISYNLVAGLEKKIDKDKLVEKSDIFTKRTICPPKAVECVETAMEALTLSVAEKAKVDFDYMSKLTGMSEDELKQELVGEIFKIPHTENTYQTASEYLSGDIRAKLREAEEIAEYDSDFNINVNALQKAMPEPLKAGDIDVKIGATWLDPKYYDQFMYELLGTPDNNRADKPQSRWFKHSLIQAEYSEHSNSWHIANKKADRSVLVNQKYGSGKMNAYEIMEHLLNLKEPKVYKTIEVPDGLGDTKEKRVIDEEATRVVQKKAKEIKKAFKTWIFKDTERREAIVDRYNELFNSIRPREFDGSALSFPMMNSSIHLHDHQRNAIAHAMFGGNTLFAHSVGAGKTFEMIATAMESKRLGLCTKSLFAVPNHLTEQIGDDFMKLYPGANILVATKKDFQKANRQQLFAKIATGNYDAVIIGHSQLGMIPMSRERQEMVIQSQIDDILEGIEELKRSEGSKFQIKAMEKTRKSLQKQLDRLEKVNQDGTITFEQLGVDKLFVDEAHEFKNLFTPTKLTNVAGISNSASQKALDLFLKCRYLDEKTGGKGVVFATGTPISNSVTELHTMMRYLEYDFLKDHGLQHFDNWVSTFGEQKTDWELKPAGNGFKERTRVAQYTGMPELMSMLKQVADIRTADTLKLDVPDCDYKVVQVEATPFQVELVQELSDRADAINSGNVDPSIDNMLKIVRC